MDPRWLPWCWSAAAAGCIALYLLTQPWRREFFAGFSLARRYPGTWLIPAGLLTSDVVAAAWRKGQLPDWNPVPAGQGVAESLLGAVHGFALGDGAALVAGVALALNAGGLRTGLRKGLESVFGRAMPGVPVLLFAGLAAVISDFSLSRMGLSVWWHAGLSVLAAPLAGWTSALVLAGLLLGAETVFRAPEKMPRVHWMETAAGHSARLWPWAMAHALTGLGVRWLPDAWKMAGCGLLLLPGMVLMFAAPRFLHVRRADEARTGWRASLRIWRLKGWQAPAWAMPAALLFFPWWLAAGWLAGGPGAESQALRITLASLHGLAHTWLTVAVLGSWMALRLKDPPTKTPPRPAVHRSPPAS